MTGCLIAMNSEAEILLCEATELSRKRHFQKEVRRIRALEKELLVCVCGVGKVNAAAGACALLQAGADCILNFGVAGGLKRENTKIGEVYLVKEAVQYDFDLTQLNGGKVGTLDGDCDNFIPLFLPPLKLDTRALGTGDRFNDSKEDHRLLIGLGCDLRDMEAAAAAQVLRGSCVPFVSVKAVSDVYGMGSTTELYQKNLAFALSNLKSYLKDIIQSL